MEIRNLKTFATIARLGSFTRAAQELGYTQANITMQIKTLEGELGLSLFDRMGKQVLLTQEGERLLPYATQILQAEQDAIGVLSHSCEPRGTLRVGVYHAVGTTFLPGLLCSFHKLYPQVHLVIKTAALDALSCMLAANALDLIWIFERELEHSEWVKQGSFPHRMVLLCGPNCPLGISRATAEDLRNCGFLMGEKSCAYRGLLERELGRQNIGIRALMEVDDPTVILQMISMDLGLAFLPQFLAQGELDKGRVCSVEVADLDQVMCSQLFTRKGRSTNAATEAFLELVHSDPIIERFTI